MIARIRALLSPRWRFRSAETGLFVTRAHALLHPTTTYSQLVKDASTGGGA